MERMTPDTDNREWLGEWIYAKFVQNYEKLLEENKNLKEKIERLEFDVDAWHQLKLLLEWEIEKLKGLQICWKTVAERIEDDKKVLRE